MKTSHELWEEYRRRLCVAEGIGLTVDVSRMDLGDEFLVGMVDRVARAHDEMARIERGERVNTDEDRMVGHYWLRDSGGGVDFGAHAVAVTGEGSELDRLAASQRWSARFPMWDWVGGRTSELSAVGLLPAALQGLDVDGLREGARACDEVTRRQTP